MSYSSASLAPASGRPRDAARESEILRSALAVLGERGYDAVTFEEVARRSHASKATLYRRWATRQEMVVAAIAQSPGAVDRPARIDTGSLRSDLLALCERLVASMSEHGGAVSLLLLQAGLDDPELCDHIERATGPTGARLPAEVLEAAIARGELPAGADPFAYEEVAGSVLLLRRLNGLPTGRAYLEHLVDAILLPALRAPHAAAPTRAIFSGSGDH